MRLNKMTLTLSQVCGDRPLILTGVSPTFEYKDSKKTDNQIGVTYEVVAPSQGYEKLRVKVADKTMFITQAEIETMNEQSEDIFVSFENFEAKIYTINGETQVSAKASKIVIVDKS